MVIHYVALLALWWAWWRLRRQSDDDYLISEQNLGIMYDRRVTIQL